MNRRVETVVLDSQGLSAWISRDRAVLAMIRSFHSMADLDDMAKLCGSRVRLIAL